jgi:hypothetical protein
MQLHYYRYSWLFLYILINIVSTFIIVNTGSHLGDLHGKPVFNIDMLVYTSILVCSTYFIILFVVFEWFTKLRFKQINTTGLLNKAPAYVGNRLAFLLLTLQVVFMYYNLSNGINIAGRESVDDTGLFKFFWIFIPVDVLFFIYYAYFRHTKLFKYNLTVWLVSNVLRGWSGAFLVILFIEGFLYYKKKGIKPLTILVVACSIISVYPFIYALKASFRGASSDYSSAFLMLQFLETLDFSYYFDVLFNGLTHILGRIQLVTMTTETIRISDELRIAFYNGSFRPFWLEGLHGIIYDNLVYGFKRDDLGVYLTSTNLFPVNDAGRKWNVNVGYLSWYFISPLLSVFYFLYTVLLLLISVFLVKKIAYHEESKNMLWFAWLIYIMPPWWSAFTLFCYSLLLFYILIYVLNKIPKFYWRVK